MRRLRDGIKSWWQGQPEKNDPRSAIFLTNHSRRHWTSRVAHAVLAFYLKEWRWLLPFIVAFVGAVVAIKKL
jgi:hypothetical protein